MAASGVPQSGASSELRARRSGTGSAGATDIIGSTRTAHDTLSAFSCLPSSVCATRLRLNLRLIEVFVFALGLSFVSPVFVLHLKSRLGDSATAVTGLLATQAATSFVAELPSGMLADLVGRKYCLIGSLLFRLAGLLVLLALEGLMPFLGVSSRFFAFGLALACEGCSQSLSGGADVALLHDSLVALGRSGEFAQRLATRGMMWPAAACIGNLVGGALAERVSVTACIYATTVVTIAALPIAASLTEVYPRVYDPARLWRKWRERRRHHKEASLVAATKHFPVSPSAPQSSTDTESSSPSDSDLCPSAPPSWRVRRNASAMSACEPHAPKPKRTLSAPNLCAVVASPLLSLDSELAAALVVGHDGEDGDGDADSHRCSSPLSAFDRNHPPDSVASCASLLRAHLSLCACTLRSSPPLRHLILLSAMLYAFSEPLHRLRGVFFHAHGIAPRHFGTIGATMFGLSALGAFVSARLVRSRDRERRGDGGAIASRMLVCGVTSSLLQCSSTYLLGVTAALPLLPVSLLWGARLPLLAHRLHAQVSDSSQRATVASVQSLANKVALAACLAAVAGPITDAHSIDACVRLCAAMTIPPVVGISHMMRK